MLQDIPPQFLLLIGGAFVLGWLVAKVGVFISNRVQAKQRDPRDDRIRSLEAEHRIAKTDGDKGSETIGELTKQLAETEAAMTERDAVLDEQMQVISQLRKDLRGSVKKTRELRAELSERATANVHAEVKLREVETELEVSRASTDMIATGVLDYTVSPDSETADAGDSGEAKIFKSAT